MNEDILRETAKQLNISYDVVEKVMKSYFNFIRFRISKVKYRELTSFDKVKTNFLLPGFGKLVVKNKKNRRFNNGKIESQSNV